MRASVTTGRGMNFRSTDVEIANIHEMTPNNAIAFRNVAFGVAARATVRGGGEIYHVSGIGSKAKARRARQ